jgi:hypothetical protein
VRGSGRYIRKQHFEGEFFKKKVLGFEKKRRAKKKARERGKHCTIRSMMGTKKRMREDIHLGRALREKNEGKG